MKITLPDNITLKAKEELIKLLKGNQDFVNGKPPAKNMTIETLKKYAFHQEPHAAILSCSDSRVIPEIIFNCGIGELFVVRIAGIAPDANAVESIEYAVKKLKLPLLILLGHDDCGVIKYAIEHYPEKTDDFKSIMSNVYPVLGRNKDITCSNFFVQQHTILVENILEEKSQIIKSAVEKGDLYIVKCHFNNSTGLVNIINS